MSDLLTPQFFDLLILLSLALGMLLAGRRFRQDLRANPPNSPDEAPAWAQDTQQGRAEDHA
ncbi:MAG: hypothetical protein OXG92_04310 [Chloroflexi bacterium]|nr:hypothetical protein [Chloroflexota bacterium]MCY3582886.1 hypothetical protein [Chloroflexota bacterium]MCY3715680.1 hypothetical protein [Chloroflexota bacterium]MDE2650582.1 hypothetical protein [Chloroflexota bacterium]MXV91901.1 hypothetical protein [Chloroflexota bacterium]